MRGNGARMGTDRCGELAKPFIGGIAWLERAGDSEPERRRVARCGGGATVRESRREWWEEVGGCEGMLPRRGIYGSLTELETTVAAAALAEVGEERRRVMLRWLKPKIGE